MALKQSAIDAVCTPYVLVRVQLDGGQGYFTHFAYHVPCNLEERALISAHKASSGHIVTISELDLKPIAAIGLVRLLDEGQAGEWVE